MPLSVQSCASAKPAIGPVFGAMCPTLITRLSARSTAGAKTVLAASVAAPALSTLRRLGLTCNSGRRLPATAGTVFFAGCRRLRAESRERRVTRPQQGLGNAKKRVQLFLEAGPYLNSMAADFAWNCPR